MWYKVKELFSNGLNKTQIGLSLGLHRQTVAKYLSMSEEAFLASECYNRQYGHKLDSYEKFIVEQLNHWPFLSSSQIHDRLKENFVSLPVVSPKIVFNYVYHVRKVHNIPKQSEDSFRPFEKQVETPYGEYAQVDFGEKWMSDLHGCKVKVYFFAMVHLAEAVISSYILANHPLPLQNPFMPMNSGLNIIMAYHKSLYTIRIRCSWLMRIMVI